MALCSFCKVESETPCTSRVDAQECRNQPASAPKRPDDLHAAEPYDPDER